MTNQPESFFDLAADVAESGVVQLTPRVLLKMVGAQRRGTLVVAQIRSQLARHHLKTDPDFAEVGADQRIEVQASQEQRAAYVEHLEQAAKQLESEPPTRMKVTPRTMLGWFGAQRRGNSIMESIEATLAGFDLETYPDFRSVTLDQSVELVRRGTAADEERQDAEDIQAHDANEAEAARVAETPGDAPQREDARASASNKQAPAKSSGPESTTFHVGTLPEANRPIVCCKPQQSLRVALSVMLSKKVSHLPIMANERSIKGMIRWKDLGRYLLHKGTIYLDDPVENLQAPVSEVRYDQPFLDVIPEILKHGYVVVRGPKNKITGIITKKDLGRQLLDLASPFVLLGEIERGLRALIENGEFTAQELRERALDPNAPREIESVADLTLGEYQRLLSHPDAWERIQVNIDKSTFISALSGVRMVRNRVMHFDPEGTNADDRKQLSQFLELIYDLHRYAVM